MWVISPHSAHIGRQSRPNLREKRRFCGLSGDVQNTASVGRFFTLWVVFPFSMRQLREISDDFKIICGLMVWVGTFPYRYCTKGKSKGEYVSINYFFKKANNKNDNKPITLSLWSGYVGFFVVLFVLKNEERSLMVNGKKTSQW